MNSLRYSESEPQCAPGGLLEVAEVSATTEPTATPTPIIAPILKMMVRVRRCFAGAIATPAGCDAATPLASGASAAAVPTGFCAGGCDWAAD